MYNYFYNYHSKPLAWDLFNRNTEDGTPPPITSTNLLVEDGNDLLTEDGIPFLTE